MNKKAFKQLLKSIDEVPEIRAMGNYEKKAREIVDCHFQNYKGTELEEVMDQLSEKIAKALSEAVEAEREVCAALVDSYALDEMEGRAEYTMKRLWAVAAAIRAQGKGKR